jgi:hypothetical protein
MAALLPSGVDSSARPELCALLRAARQQPDDGAGNDPGLRRDLKEHFGCEASCWPSSA